MQPIQEILYMVGLMKFKTQKKTLKNNKKMLKIEILQILADGKFIFFGTSTAYTHTKMTNCKKPRFRPRVEFSNTLLCVIKIQKRKKLRKL